MRDRIYAVGDIHGQLGMLEDAVARIEQDGGADARVVFLGDYVDRGPNSRDVIEFFLDGQSRGKDWICLMGNHDRMFAMFLEDYPRNDRYLLIGYHWLHERIGGIQTLESYGVQADANERIYKLHERVRAAVPERHRQFLDGLKFSHLDGDLLFVHAGIVPGVPLDAQKPDDLIWIRDEFHNDTRAHPWLVVHGHTPVAAARHYGNRVNLDTGAGYGRPLSTAVFEGRDCWLLTDHGRLALDPSAP